jgi:hypothetical protein
MTSESEHTAEAINRAVHKAVGGCIGHKPNLKHWKGQLEMPCESCGEPLVYSNPNPRPIPDYTSDISSAMKFAEKLIAEGWDFFLSKETKTIWEAEFFVDGKDGFSKLDRSPAMAICLAGLAALGISTEE